MDPDPIEPRRDAPVAVRALVEGRVQGIGFRWSARGEAQRLGVVGWVRNLRDGRVEAWVEGDPARVEAMLAWLAAGPPGADVRALERFPREPEGRLTFEIARSS